MSNGEPRPLWKGGINFGLVHIPVALYSAEKSAQIDFDLLDKNDLERIHYSRVNEKSGEEVEWADIVKGYKNDNDEYIVVTEEDFEEARIESSPNIEIVSFIDKSEISILYFERPYYLVPEEKAFKVYTLLREVLENSERAAVAKVVMRNREHLCLLLPVKEVIVLNTLRFEDELRDPEELPLPSRNSKRLSPTNAEVKMAEKLIEEMDAPWNPSEFKDTYTENLLAIIRRKSHSKNAPRKRIIKEPKYADSNVVDIVELLKKSLNKKENRQSSKRKTSKAA